jgi:hypothetical protein
MTPIEFLRTVWPETGVYCLATKAGKGYVHHTFDTVDAAAAFAVSNRDRQDVWFAVHTLTEHRVWNARKRKDADGEWEGGWSYRTGENMRSCKAFFFDLDVGADKDYASQRDAIIAIKSFCDKTSLPLPMLVNSGRGVHVYWRLDEELASLSWKAHAARLFNLAIAHELKVDPARTTDITSLLRVAATFNCKKAPKLPVLVWKPGTVTPTHRFLELLDQASEDAGGLLTSFAPAAAYELGTNTTIEFDGPPVTMRQLGDACGQIREFAIRRGNVHYNAWHKVLAVLRHVENGPAYAHALSSGHPDYDKDVLDQKLWHQERDAIGPTTCGVMRANCDPDICRECPYWNLAKSPLSAARLPKPTTEMPDVALELEPPCPPPAGFMRVEGGGVIFRKRTEDKVIPVTILSCDLYPLQRNVDAQMETDQHDWCAKLPNEEAKTFTLDSGIVQEPVMLAKELSKHGVYVTPGDNKLVQLYMSLYIKDLQKLNTAERQSNCLGWTEGHAEFVLPDVTLAPGGQSSVSHMHHRTLTHLRNARGMGKAGTLEKQKKLMNFYNQHQYLDRQFYILCGLAAPFYHATGYHGSIIHATGLPGASKSTTLFAAMSMWGHPQKMPLNGQSSGATANARDQIISVMNNLPVGMDEITNIADDVAKEFALNVSQTSNQKIRLKQTGELRTEGGGDKSTLILTTGNSSLHSILSRNNVSGDAGSMRVFEIVFHRPSKTGKALADKFMFELCENYGHIGPALMRYAVDHYAEIVKLVQAEKIKLDALVDLEPHERFWSADGAVALAIGRVANKLGLLPFNVNAIRDWLVNAQFPAMRGTVKDQYPTATEILTSYIEASGDGIVFVPEGNTSILREPRAILKGRYEASTGLLWLTKNMFSDYCAMRRAPFQQYINELAINHVITDRNIRKVLTTGTNISPTRSHCFCVNMRHAEMGDLGSNADKLAQGRPVLRVVPIDKSRKK